MSDLQTIIDAITELHDENANLKTNFPFKVIAALSEEIGDYQRQIKIANQQISDMANAAVGSVESEAWQCNELRDAAARADILHIRLGESSMLRDELREQLGDARARIKDLINQCDESDALLDAARTTAKIDAKLDEMTAYANPDAKCYNRVAYLGRDLLRLHNPKTNLPDFYLGKIGEYQRCVMALRHALLGWVADPGEADAPTKE